MNTNFAKAEPRHFEMQKYPPKREYFEKKTVSHSKSSFSCAEGQFFLSYFHKYLLAFEEIDGGQFCFY